MLSVLDPDNDVGDLAQSVEPKMDVHHLQPKTSRQHSERASKRAQERTGTEANKVMERKNKTKPWNERIKQSHGTNR